MAKFVTDYTRQITEKEKKLLNTLSKTIGDEKLVNAIYEDFIKFRDVDKMDYASEESKSGECINSPADNLDETTIRRLVEDSHKQNTDYKLRNKGSVELVNETNDGSEVVKFKIMNNVVGAITKEGNYTGKFAGMTGSELKKYIADAVNKLLNSSGHIHDNYLDYNIIARHIDLRDLESRLNEKIESAYQHDNIEVLDKITQEDLDLLRTVQVPYRKDIFEPVTLVEIPGSEHGILHNADYKFSVEVFLKDGDKIVPYMPKNWSVKQGFITVEFSNDVPFKGIIVVK